MNLVLEFLHSLQVQQLTQTAQQQAHQPHLMPNIQSQTMTSVPLSMTMAANPNTVNPGTIRNQLGQLPQVHVIHQPMHSPSYLPQYTYNQQQLMLQNMQGKGFQNQMLGIFCLQGTFCPSLGAEFRPHSLSKIATFSPNTMSVFPN